MMDRYSLIAKNINLISLNLHLNFQSLYCIMHVFHQVAPGSTLSKPFIFLFYELATIVFKLITFNQFILSFYRWIHNKLMTYLKLIFLFDFLYDMEC